MLGFSSWPAQRDSLPFFGHPGMALGVLSRCPSLTSYGVGGASQNRAPKDGLLCGNVHRCELPSQLGVAASRASFATGSGGSSVFTVRGSRRALLQTSSCSALLSVARPSSANDVYAAPVTSASQRQSQGQNGAPVASGAQFRLPPPPTRVTAPGRVIAGKYRRSPRGMSKLRGIHRPLATT